MANFVRTGSHGATGVCSQFDNVERERETISISLRDRPIKRDIGLYIGATDFRVVNTPRNQAVNAVVETTPPQQLKRLTDGAGVDVSNTLSRGGFDPIEDKSHTLRAERIAAGVTIFDDYNQCVKKDQSTIGTITTNIGSKTFRNGVKLIEDEGDL